MNIKPSFSDLSKRPFDDLFESADPSLLPRVELDLCYARCLYLFELLNPESLPLNRHIEYAVVLQKLIALGANVDHSLYHFFLDEQRVEAEVRELLGEVVLGYRDHAEVGDFSGWGLRGEAEVRLNHVL